MCLILEQDSMQVSAVHTTLVSMCTDFFGDFLSKKNILLICGASKGTIYRHKNQSLKSSSAKWRITSKLRSESGASRYKHNI